MTQPEERKSIDHPPFAYPAEQFQRYLSARGLSPAAVPEENRDDLMLCAGCADGDARAWEAFFLRYRSFLTHVACQLTGDAAEGEELAARIVALLLERNKMASYTGRGSFRGWLRAVAAHLFLDGKRRDARARLSSIEDLPVHRLPAVGPEEGCERHYRRDHLEEIAGRVEAALADLSDREAGFVNLYYFQDLTLAEAAALLNVHESTASRWNTRILEHLRHGIIRFLEKEKKWSRAEVADFMDRCLAYLADRLSRLRHRLGAGPFSCKFPGKGRPSDDESESHG